MLYPVRGFPEHGIRRVSRILQGDIGLHHVQHLIRHGYHHDPLCDLQHTPGYEDYESGIHRSREHSTTPIRHTDPAGRTSQSVLHRRNVRCRHRILQIRKVSSDGVQWKPAVILIGPHSPVHGSEPHLSWNQIPSRELQGDNMGRHRFLILRAVPDIRTHCCTVRSGFVGPERRHRAGDSNHVHAADVYRTGIFDTGT